ncbi:mechanosensitive ion channel family protein [Mesohalobacter halotolerans]|uniref:Mechanosensitive ion channel n=1 Tax=Mesohalobacter halotolerans TaxID=1883405 RepID=A0A4U5TPQ5_9FLAO|nr:mechanosensitive ion channel domain-containing protein [Mesohalobacter halotolerans]MBS3739575.1 mechanosensitive ion channel [Psychroflexus sp.]TKS56117.1 mechanosensitive ion channel [Mesohalobacter halotolerans]
MENYLDQIIDLLVAYAPKVLGAIVTLIVGLWLIKIIVKAVRKNMEKRGVDASLVPFLSTIFAVALKILLFVSVIGMVGVEATSFVAILGAAGLAIGLSLQGTLQNFAGGVVLLLLRPFRVGDVIDAKGYLGTVQEIQIFYTILHTFDKKVVYIPNGALANSDMTNLSQQDDRRNQWTFGIGYGDDVAKAKEVIQKLIDADDRILKDPEPFIAVHSLGDSSVNIVVRTWSKAADLWPVYFDMNENVYNEFAKEGLNIPFPQMDVHLHKQNN